MSKYCKWFCMELVSDNTWIFQSNCGERRIVSRWHKFYKHIYKDDDSNLCPKCGKPITVGALMD